MKQLFYFLALLALPAAAQVGIGTTAPLAGAILEVKSSSGGLLIPRLNVTQRTGIVSPPQGLLVYQTDGTAGGGSQSGFWYYAGTGGWVYLNASASLTLPYAGTASTSGAAFDVTNTGTGSALSGTGSGTTSAAVQGLNNSTATSAIGVLGTTASGYGVRGIASASGGYGVAGLATDSRGVSGFSASGVALYGNATTGLAVQGVKGSGDKGRVAQFTSTDAANDSTGVYASTAGARPALRAVNTNASAQAALRGVKTAGTDGIGVEGVVTSGGGNAAGVRGLDQSGTGIGTGVLGLTTGGYGVRGIASATDSYGVVGSSNSGPGVSGNSSSGPGVSGSSGANVATTAGVLGVGNGGSSAVGVLGTTTSGYGVRGVASASGGYGVSGLATDSYGVIGQSTSGRGVYGSTGASGPGLAGVVGTNGNSSGTGVLGTTTSGSGVQGEATGSSGYGVLGTASGNNGYALIGSATGEAGGLAASTSGTGRAAYFSQSNSSNPSNALEVQNSGSGTAIAVTHPRITTFPSSIKGLVINDASGTARATLNSNSLSLDPLNGTANSVILDADYGGNFNVKNNDALYALCTASGVATPSNYAAINTEGRAGALAGRFTGNVAITGSLSKGGGSFKIDHPLDPENQYLYHSFVESPDMLNIYNGNVVLDAQGEAVVQLPDWFETLNRNFRYQLTPIGAAFTPYILAKVAGNKFRIAGQPGAEVSWQVTGIRQDKWANQNRIPIEQAKEPENRGRYLHPAAYGQPAERGIGYRPALTGHSAPAAATTTVITR